MWRLLLFFVLSQLGYSSCPDGYDLVKDGECRGLQTAEVMYYTDATRFAAETCNKIKGKPVIIHDEEQQSYWLNLAPAPLYAVDNGFYDYLMLGITCNKTTHKWEWVDGSPIDYKPEGHDVLELDKSCTMDWGWFIDPTAGHWGYGTNQVIRGYFFCTTQLEPVVRGPNGCESFADDDESGVCYQVGAAAKNWKDAQMECKKGGAELASIHNKQENDFVRRQATSRGVVEGLFLGGSADKDGKFGWADGTNMYYDNYYPGFPKKNFGNCIAMDTSSSAGMWMNVDCASKFPFACIKPEGPLSEPRCSGEDYDEGAIITSPGYPYSASTPCDYFFTAESGKKVELEILSLEANSCCDSLLLYDGYFGGSVIAKLSGIVENKMYTTNSTNIMRVSWQPEGGVNVKGVAMTYRVV